MDHSLQHQTENPQSQAHLQNKILEVAKTTTAREMMKINSRTVSFYEIQLNTLSNTDSVKHPPQLDFCAFLKFASTQIKPKQEIRYANTPIEVTESRWDESRSELHLLLNMADPEKSDVSYRKRSTKARRQGNKATDEDIEASSHVVIRANHTLPTASFAMTTGAGIPPPKIVTLLKDIYKTSAKSDFIKSITNIPLPSGVTDKNGKPQTYKVSHSFQFSGMPNGSLVEIIKTGRITDATLIDTGIHKFDTSSNFCITKLQMKVELKSVAVDVNFLKGLIKSAKSKRKFNADQIRIEYINSDDDESVKPKSKLFNSNGLDEMFTKSETVMLDTTHHDHQSAISDEIIGKMQALL